MLFCLHHCKLSAYHFINLKYMSITDTKIDYSCNIMNYLNFFVESSPEM